MDVRAMPDDVLYEILDHLHLPDMINTFQAFPTFILVHGVRNLWISRMDRTHISFTTEKSKISWNWVFENERLLRKYDLFIFARNQGDLDMSDNQVLNYLEFEACISMTPTWGQNRQMTLWGIKDFRCKYGYHLMSKCYRFNCDYY